jgi:hypothetical protein
VEGYLTAWAKGAIVQDSSLLVRRSATLDPGVILRKALKVLTEERQCVTAGGGNRGRVSVSTCVRVSRYSSTRASSSSSIRESGLKQRRLSLYGRLPNRPSHARTLCKPQPNTSQRRSHHRSRQLSSFGSQRPHRLDLNLCPSFIHPWYTPNK